MNPYSSDFLLEEQFSQSHNDAAPSSLTEPGATKLKHNCGMNESKIEVIDNSLLSQGFSNTFIFRFWQKVRKTDSCWLWLAATDRFGYGMITKRHSTGVIAAHRASWILHKGVIPKGMCVLHNCPSGDNPSCVNPDHLFLGTRTDNAIDRDFKYRGRHPVGECLPRLKLTNEKVLEIRQLSNAMSGRKIAKIFGVSKNTIQGVLNGATWKHVV